MGGTQAPEKESILVTEGHTVPSGGRPCVGLGQGLGEVGRLHQGGTFELGSYRGCRSLTGGAEGLPGTEKSATAGR